MLYNIMFYKSDEIKTIRWNVDLVNFTNAIILSNCRIVFTLYQTHFPSNTILQLQTVHENVCALY